MNKKKRTLPDWMKNASTRVELTGLDQNPSTGSGSDRPAATAHNDLLRLPLMDFSGKITYSYEKGDCSLLCEDLEQSLDGELVVGFDMEWPVSYQAGSTCKTAVIQLCINPDSCLVFQIGAMSGVPKALFNLITDNRLKKVGVNIESDLWKLARDFDDFPARQVIAESVVDLSSLANSTLNSSERWSLDGLTQHLLQRRLDKSSDIRLGAWDLYPLSEDQLRYAATDAYVSLMIYKELEKRQKS